MGFITGIAWCDHTFNCWIGCTKVSDGCKFCYAENWDKRYREGTNWGPGAPRQMTSDANWKLPKKWDKIAGDSGVRRRVFCASLADVFDHEAPIGGQARLWALIAECPNLDWLLLTKRPHNIRSMVPTEWLTEPLANVWYGTSVEDNRVRQRILTLAAIPAAVRFLSIEPMIGPIDYPEEMMDIDWAIYGGESHDSPLMAREMKLEWIRDGLDVCRKYNVAPFVKQLGGRYAMEHKLSDKKGGNPIEWPEDVRVREFPSRRVA